ncbi:unnamed protein product [Tuber aestivum]|uniref:Uncharacterized protein n=1 Tax=Tuber aestivum TaxID=59557 RepID=A0A292Q054_9PEZI|nr:unnamed protein product [Tuber aestivum]
MVTEKRKRQSNLTLVQARESKLKKSEAELTSGIQRREKKENTYFNYTNESDPETEPPTSDDSDSEFDEEADTAGSEATTEDEWCGEIEENTIQMIRENQNRKEGEEEEEESLIRGRLVTDLKYHTEAGGSLKNIWGDQPERSDGSNAKLKVSKPKHPNAMIFGHYGNEEKY